MEKIPITICPACKKVKKYGKYIVLNQRDEMMLKQSPNWYAVYTACADCAKARKEVTMRRYKRKHKNKLTRHHLTPKTLGGGVNPENILMIYRDKHDIWHKLFGILTLEQTILMLQRVARMKGRTQQYA